MGGSTHLSFKSVFRTALCSCLFRPRPHGRQGPDAKSPSIGGSGRAWSHTPGALWIDTGPKHGTIGIWGRLFWLYSPLARPALINFVVAFVCRRPLIVCKASAPHPKIFLDQYHAQFWGLGKHPTFLHEYGIVFRIVFNLGFAGLLHPGAGTLGVSRARSTD